MILAFDLDDCICKRPKNLEHLGSNKYNYCEPITDMVNLVNECYNKGHYIKIYTARGMTTFNGDVNKIYGELYDLTVNDLKKWGVKYHKLIMGKEHYDLLIDDKVINSLDVKSFTDLDKKLKN